MTKDELLAELTKCADAGTETGHVLADQLLIDYINDPEIEDAYLVLERYFS